MAAKLVIFGMMVVIIIGIAFLAWSAFAVPALFDYKETETKLEHERQMQGIEDPEEDD